MWLSLDTEAGWGSPRKWCTGLCLAVTHAGVDHLSSVARLLTDIYILGLEINFLQVTLHATNTSQTRLQKFQNNTCDVVSVSLWCKSKG